MQTIKIQKFQPFPKKSKSKNSGIGDVFALTIDEVEVENYGGSYGNRNGVNGRA